MQKENYIQEIILTLLAYVWLLFVATNVNVTLGQTYLSFALGSLALLIITATVFDKKVQITFQKQPGGTLKAILVAIGGWFVLLILSIVILKFVSPSQATVGAIINLLGTTTPALAQSKVANFLTFGVVIAFIETSLWARGLEFTADLFGVDINKKGIVKIFTFLFLLVLIFAFVFALFHLTAKGITNLPSLIIVFVMMVISLAMVCIYEETRQAVYMHIFANSVASWLILFAVKVLT
jgi:hypothetical protein